MKKRYLVVINPLTGNKGQRYLKKLTRTLEVKHIDYDIFYTDADVEKSKQQISSLLKGVTDVVAIGGDGTLNLLSNVLVHKSIPLGVIPCGTGNDFARYLYNKTDDVINTVTSDHAINIDLGKCHDRYFINVMGVGYDGMVAEKTRSDKKILFRSFFYLWHALKYLLVYRERNIKLTSAGFNKHEDTFMVVFGNGAFFGSGMNITPHADISDGVLDCCWIGKLSFLIKCYCLVKLYSGKHLATQNIEYFNAKRFEVTTHGQPVEADGEFVGYTPVVVQCEEKALLLKVPA